MRMADVISKMYAFATDITLCHDCTSLNLKISPVRTRNKSILSDILTNCKNKFNENKFNLHILNLHIPLFLESSYNNNNYGCEYYGSTFKERR